MNNNFTHKKNYIYKFVPFSLNTLKILIKGELWLGAPNDLNDPFEGEFILEEIKTSLINEFKVEFYSKILNLSGDELSEKLYSVHASINIFRSDITKFITNKIKTEYGVSSFSISAENALMWSHYSGSHKGICLVFDKDELFKSFNDLIPPVKFETTIYEENLPKASLSLTDNEFVLTSIDDIINQKTINWEYENEIRFYKHFQNNNTPRSLKFNKQSLKWIIFGEKIEEDDTNTLSNLINNCSEYIIEWAKSSKDLMTAKMKIEKVELVNLNINLSTTIK